MKQVVIYPRGFAGFDIGLPVRIIKPSNNAIFKSILHNTSGVRENKNVISNTDVEALWKGLCSGNKFISNEKFRESILVAALTSFGTNDFYEWVTLQTKNQYLGNEHIRFINDTFNFIKTGQRSLNILMWLQLLAGSSDPSASSVKINLEYFGTNKPLHRKENANIKDTIIKWVSQPNGFEDLLGTMHILFGDSEIL